MKRDVRAEMPRSSWIRWQRGMVLGCAGAGIVAGSWAIRAESGTQLTIGQAESSEQSPTLPEAKLRSRTDAQASRDQQSAAAWHRRLAEGQAATSLSDVARAASNAAPRVSEPSPSAVVPASYVVGQAVGVDACGNWVWESTPATPLPSQLPSTLDGEATERPRVAPGTQPPAAPTPSDASPITSRRLPLRGPLVIGDRSIAEAAIGREPQAAPMTIRPLDSGDSFAAPSSAITRRAARPVRVNQADDSEAETRPGLGGSSASLADSPSTIEDPNVAPSVYQSPGTGFAAPTFPPATGSGAVMPPTTGSVVAPTYPPATGAVTPSYPAPSTTTVGPSTSSIPMNTPGTVVTPLNTVPGYGSTLPQYSTRGSTIVSGEPFVTGPPCQFDAYDMVEPASYSAADPCGPGAVPLGGTVSPYTQLPGTIIPPTYTPNQVPMGLYPSGGTGWRPLIGFGQDNYNIEVGRGVFGQPVAYVVGQPVRNFLRYIFP